MPQWSCSKCTLLNNPEDNRCNACGGEKYPRVNETSEQGGADPWIVAEVEWAQVEAEMEEQTQRK